MKNQTSLPRWAGFFALALVFLVFAGHGFAATEETKKAMVEKRADVLTIDAMAADGKLSLPAVTFLHDQHTKALSAMKKDCSSCHKPLKPGDAGAYSFRFMDTGELTGEALKETFHANCIGCHIDLAKAGKKSGPLDAECRTCHNPAPAVSSNWQDIGLDKRIHYNHTVSKFIPVAGNKDKNCAACHHVFDPDKQKLVWGENKEDSCRACHLLPKVKKAALAKNPAASDDNGPLQKRLTLDVATHQSCVNCHLALAAKKDQVVEYGPFDCAGCHSPAAQAAFAAQSAKTPVDSIPRLKRGQADVVLLMPEPAKPQSVKGMMATVSFNHKFHEAMTLDCRGCHHKKIASCADCHSYEGKAEGNFINLSMAMHKPDARQSCVGCHNIKTQQASCAGCHTQIPLKLSHNSCATCHVSPPGVNEEQGTNPAYMLGLSKEKKEALAASGVYLRDRESARGYDQIDIPEKVTLGLLAKEFEASEMPHRKIVNALWEKQRNSRLAVAFHTDKGTLCQGCHHNSPLSKTPPKCVSCHSVDSQSAPGGRLSLKAAYHQQCMTCHARMNQKPAATECAECHKIRGN